MHISPNDLACSTHHGEAESDRCLLPIVILVRLVDGDHAVRCPDAVLLVVVHHSFDAGRPVVEKLAHGITLGSHHERRRENERSRVSRTELLLENASRAREPWLACAAPRASNPRTTCRSRNRGASSFRTRGSTNYSAATRPAFDRSDTSAAGECRVVRGCSLLAKLLELRDALGRQLRPTTRLCDVTQTLEPRPLCRRGVSSSRVLHDLSVREDALADVSHETCTVEHPNVRRAQLPLPWLPCRSRSLHYDRR